MKGAPSEVVIFAGMAAFGLIAGGAYGVLTGDVVGTTLLGVFGIAASVAAISVRRGLGTGSKGETGVGGVGSGGAASEKLDATEELPALPEGERFPAPGWAPFGVAVGLGMVGFGLSLGPWLLIVGALLTIAAAWTWLTRAMAEDDEARVDEGHATRATEGPEADPHP